jgi:ATP synthase protein I
MQKLLIVQIAIVAVVAGFFALRGSDAVLAALYGGAIALGNSMLLGRRAARLAAPTTEDGRRAVMSLYFGAVERFVFTLGAMAIGMGFLKLDPVGLLAAFAAAQIGYMVACAPRFA